MLVTNVNHLISSIDLLTGDCIDDKTPYETAFKPINVFSKYALGILKKHYKGHKIIRFYRENGTRDIEIRLSQYMLSMKYNSLIPLPLVRHEDRNKLNCNISNLYVPTSIEITNATPIGTIFKPEIPFDKYPFAILMIDQHTGYKYVRISIHNQETTFGLARYLLSVRYGSDVGGQMIVYKDGNNRNYEQDNIDITDTSQSLTENPPLGIYFKPEAPFDGSVKSEWNFRYGHVKSSLQRGRRQIQLHGVGIKQLSMYCARYLLIVETYRKTRKLVDTSDLHAHHLDGDKLNDVFSNLEWIFEKEHSREHFQTTCRKPLLCCPICKTTFNQMGASNQAYTKPICCTTRCQLTLDINLQPAEQYKELLAKLARIQTLYADIDSEFMEFDLQKAINKPIKYGPFQYASEAEQLQQIQRCISEKLTIEQVSWRFQISISKILQLLEMGKLQKRTLSSLIQVRDMLRNGYTGSEISKELKTSPANISMFIKKYRYVLYPL